MNVTKQYTQLVVNHVLLQVQAEGNNQKYLADFLGIPDTRISEAKNGKLAFNNAQIECLAKHYSLPRRAPGEYVTAESYPTVDSFIESYHKASKARHFSRLKEAFNRGDYLKVLCSHFIIIPEGTHGQLMNVQEMETKELQRYLTAYLNTNEITDWYQATTEQLNRADTQQTFELERPKHANVDGHAVAIDTGYESRVLWSLFWFAYLHNERSDKNQAPTIREYILTGDIVLDERTLSLSKTPLSQPYSDVFASKNITEMWNRGYDYFDIKVNNPLCTLPDKWDEVKFQLFCTESLDYHLLLKLRAQRGEYDPANARTVIIKQVKIGVLFQEIETLRKWLGMPWDLNEQMKTEIAKLGGYVPGVEVL